MQVTVLLPVLYWAEMRSRGGVSSFLKPISNSFVIAILQLLSFEASLRENSDFNWSHLSPLVRSSFEQDAANWNFDQWRV